MWSEICLMSGSLLLAKFRPPDSRQLARNAGQPWLTTQRGHTEQAAGAWPLNGCSAGLASVCATCAACASACASRRLVKYSTSTSAHPCQHIGHIDTVAYLCVQQLNRGSHRTRSTGANNCDQRVGYHPGFIITECMLFSGAQQHSIPPWAGAHARVAAGNEVEVASG